MTCSIGIVEKRVGVAERITREVLVVAWRGKRKRKARWKFRQLEEIVQLEVGRAAGAGWLDPRALTLGSRGGPDHSTSVPRLVFMK